MRRSAGFSHGDTLNPDESRASATMTTTFQASGAPLKTVQEIQFGLFSPEEIKSMSVCHIEYPETMDEQRHRPREKGLNDPKLGTIDRSQMCATCGESQQECPGHFGHIELAVPVFHVGELRRTVSKSVSSTY